MINFFFVIVLLATYTLCGVAAKPTILTGMVTHVRDGDTIEVGKIPIRLNGVSAPELHELLGNESKQFMNNMIVGKHLTCELSGERTYDRYVGTCYMEEQDIGEILINNGLALDCPRYSNGRYAQFEKKKAQKNIELPTYCGKKKNIQNKTRKQN